VHWIGSNESNVNHSGKELADGGNLSKDFFYFHHIPYIYDWYTVIAILLPILVRNLTLSIRRDLLLKL
jgi:hypothetical protein